MNGKKKGITPRIGGAVYILPNMLTAGNLFFGFFSIVKSMQGDFNWAAGAILLAAIFDVLDGRVARLTNGTSEFGVQFDSLCDLVSFGLAPAFLMYQYALNELGRIGWIVCFIFLACGALRLARFNVQSSIGKANGDFTGLPIPMAAGVIACFTGFMTDLDEGEEPKLWIIQELYNLFTWQAVRQWFLFFMALLLALMMVSNIAYRSHKSMRVSGIKAFRLLALLIVTVGLAAYRPTLVGFLFFFFYALSGPFEWIVGWKKPTDDDEIFQPHHQGSMMEPGAEGDSEEGERL